MTTRFSLNPVCLLLFAAAFARAETVNPEYRPEPLPQAMPEFRQPETPAAVLPSAETGHITDIDEAGLLAQPQLLNRLLDQSVMDNDIEGIRVLLPVYRKLPDTVRDDILLRLAKSKLSMYEGRFAEAASLLRGLIAEKPESDVIRFHLALALFYDNQDRAAQDQIDKLLAQTALPEREKNLLAAFQEELQKRHRWRFDGGLNYTYEPNINNAPAVKQEGRLKSEAEAENVSGIAYRFGAEKDRPLTGNWLAKFSADLYGKYYPSAKHYNDLAVQAAAGIGYRNANRAFSLMPYAQHRRFGEDAEPYSDSFGTKFDTDIRLNPKWRIINHVAAEKIRYENRTRFNGNILRFGQTVVYQADPRQAWFGGYEFERENLRDRDNSNRRQAVSLGWIQEWPKGFSSRASATWGKRTYRAPMPWPILETRRDRTLGLNLSLWHRNIHFWGVTPRLTMRHTRNRSNVFLYDYRKNNLFVEMTKTF
ncbi:surface lipoprotein assembly modifier [Neisseria sp. Dent CA1/247]|uniref:porin family protein n=1 Tax=Neisseria sp. Dent CA1/247 TaxID=2912675 RepID=UPI001FD00482|nr:porin family protein [Neisseria sp. Dent CA1/247]UOO76985.1 surface lipoprotein assembly modifier [Neisseria sp. Dent CA1/247]